MVQKFLILIIDFLILSLVKSEGNKFNVVLFLADHSLKSHYSDCGDMESLGFIRKPNIKDCTPELESKIASSVPDFGQHTANSCNCVDLLKSGLLSLINYCRNVAGMTTVLASLNNDSLSNDLRFNKKHLEYYNRNDINEGTMYKRIVSTNPYPGFFPKKLKFKKINNKRSNIEIITKPEHTETFKIRTKRQEQMTNRTGTYFHNTPSNSKSKSLWHLLGIVEGIKLTFLGKLFENDMEDNMGPSIKRLTQPGTNSLFELVSNALSNLMESNCDKGFLMIVLGGNLTDIHDVYSPLLQSIKHVIDNTDEKNTLIVLTGNCPREEFEVVDMGLDENFPHCMFPVYIRGSHCEALTDIFELYDIPYTLKKIINTVYPPLDTHEGEAIKIDYVKDKNSDNYRRPTYQN